MAQTAAHLADHVIPPVPVRQWVISVPKRLRGMLADRPQAVAALTKIFLAEVERLLLAASAEMLAWENSGFSIDASVRITLLDRDVPGYFQSLEHLLRYCARPPFAIERLSVIRDADRRITRIRYVMPRHKAANWVGPGRDRKSTRPGANGVVELTPFEFLDQLADLVPPPRKHRHRPAGGWRGGRAKPRLWLRPPEAAGAMAGHAAVKQARSIRAEPPAAAGRHGAGRREHWHAVRACGRRASRERLF
jgi:hypothetical protein